MEHGITRIRVASPRPDGPGADRFERARSMHAAANAAYRNAFRWLFHGPALVKPGEIELPSDSGLGGLDRHLGIDVIVTMDNGMELTIQEKVLFTQFDTLTVEYEQDPETGELGDWAKCRAMYYFCGYASELKGMDADDPLRFRRWMLVDWPALQRATLNGLEWEEGHNARDGAKASFRFLAFEDVPIQCVVDQWPKPV